MSIVTKSGKNVKHVVARRMGEETIAVNLTTGDAFSLNLTAADIFEQSRNGETTRQIALYLSSHYDVDADDALREVEKTLKLLTQAGLLDSDDS